MTNGLIVAARSKTTEIWTAQQYQEDAVTLVGPITGLTIAHIGGGTYRWEGDVAVGYIKFTSATGIVVWAHAKRGGGGDISVDIEEDQIMIVEEA